MSRQNKVNPGMYTQRGRLTQDDAARELKRQREIGSQYTWQPVKKDAFPRLAPQNQNPDRATETTEDAEVVEAPVKAKAKTAKKTTGKATKTAKSAKPAAKAKATKTVRRQAVLARNVGGGGPKPRQAAKRRKS